VPNARPIDAAEGYRLFLRSNGRVELDEINEYLGGRGLRPVSPRMYMHYGRLRRHGFESYIPINRFDIAVAGEHAWSEDLRARYGEIAQPAEARAMWDAGWHQVMVESSGPATASVLSPVSPSAGSPIILKWSTTGIERTGTVVRVDPGGSRFHIAFDPYSSVPIAPADSPGAARFTIPLADEASSVVVVTDLLVRLDRLIGRASAGEAQIARVTRISLNSPLELAVVGGGLVVAAAKLVKDVVIARRDWHEGTKAKYEAEGVALDNEAKRRVAQQETDAAIRAALEAEIDQENPPLMGQLASERLPLGPPGSSERLRLAAAASAATELPIDIEVEESHRDQGGPSDGANADEA
jgi:hypothetical protein